jgi:hypothetical protein
MYLLGMLCLVFAFADFWSFTLLGIDMTGVSWSPIAASAAGGVLLHLGARSTVAS